MISPAGMLKELKNPKYIEDCEIERTIAIIFGSYLQRSDKFVGVIGRLLLPSLVRFSEKNMTTHAHTLHHNTLLSICKQRTCRATVLPSLYIICVENRVNRTKASYSLATTHHYFLNRLNLIIHIIALLVV